ncbi:hypothetical protein NE237_001887 [Protea cynaroides]|uniref:Uncharacterized protein n=1 Tax=Protea cynaroides TaxID=273540 RepID=A0A9Q0KU76_9MAGN|nr:hypothetical protein NE237_001887 [Protea cynaroides]
MWLVKGYTRIGGPVGHCLFGKEPSGKEARSDGGLPSGGDEGCNARVGKLLDMVHHHMWEQNSSGLDRNKILTIPSRSKRQQRSTDLAQGGGRLKMVHIRKGDSMVMDLVVVHERSEMTNGVQHAGVIGRDMGVFLGSSQEDSCLRDAHVMTEGRSGTARPLSNAEGSLGSGGVGLAMWTCDGGE